MDISVFCHTNIDKHRSEKWPNTMCCRPVVGDYVKCIGFISLKICTITHCHGGGDGPYLDIELTNGMETRHS